jgi:4-aminobutyrate aminotransferase-like enzyme
LVGAGKKPDAESTKRLMELTKNHGLLLGKGGTYGNVLRVSPPLNIDKEEVDQALKILDRSFAQLGQ